MFPPPIDPEDMDPEADRLLCAAIYLMSCHARNHCPRLACMIGHHLELISRHPGSTERIALMCRQLRAAWEAIRQFDERTEAPALRLSH
jgi:hypothetical protein